MYIILHSALSLNSYLVTKFSRCVQLFCNPMDCSLQGSSLPGILQARVLEWVAISFCRGSSQPGIEPGSPALQADALPSEPPAKPWACNPPSKLV